MFRRCYDITEFDFSELDISLVINMLWMFFYCSIIPLNLFYFDSLQVIKMDDMFSYSILLNSLNISNLALSNVEQIKKYI